MRKGRTRHCTCDRCEKPGPYEKGRDCWLCWLYWNDADYHRHWSNLSKPEAKRAAALRLPCVHEGPVRSKCPVGDPSRDIRLCHLLGTGVMRATTCRKCEHYAEPPAPAMPRHLIYFLYPVANNSVWQCCVDQLLERLDLFDGQRVVCVAKQAGRVNPRREGARRPAHTVDPPSAVRDRFGDRRVEFIEIENDQRFGEVAAWVPLMEKVAGLPGYTWYSHGKGTTRPVNHGVSVHPWATCMYAANLDYWPVVERSLRDFPITGAFKKLGRFGPVSRAHYSGTAYWMRNADVFARDWRTIDRMWGGVESAPGRLFAPEEMGCFFRDGTANLYDFTYLRTVLAEFSAWSEANAEHRRPGAGPTPWLDVHGYG